jgi:hypothetical protein
VLRESLGAYDAHLKDARNREQVGTAARNEVLAVQVERDRAELSLLAAQESVAVAEADLQRLLDLPAGTRVETAEELESQRPLRTTRSPWRPRPSPRVRSGRRPRPGRGGGGAHPPRARRPAAAGVGRGRRRLREPEPQDPAAVGGVGPHVGRRR